MTIPSNAYAHSETALEADYLAMSQNLEREREAVEWIEWIDGLNS